jgi:hypothetical protein
MPSRTLRHITFAILAASAWATIGACGARTKGGPIEPRFVAVHNTLAAMGLAQIGPLRQGSLQEGRAARIAVELAAECATIVAIGADSVRDLDVTLVDPSGSPLAHDTAHQPEATIRVCPETAGTYTLVVKMAAGSGDYLLGTWSGGASKSVAPAASVAAAASLANGTCEAPIPIRSGNYTGSTSHGESENEGSCASSSARELVYRLDLSSRQHVSIEVLPQRFDSVLYVRKDDCTDADSEVACNDDAPNQHRSKVDAILEAGTYFVFVDGYSNEGGSFAMKVSVADIPSIAEVCRQAQPLAFGAPASGSSSGAFDQVGASCGDGAKGPDVAYKLDVPRRERVRVVLDSSDFAPVVHLRKQCANEQSEVGCGDAGAMDHQAAFVGVLDPGSFAVFADTSDHDGDGAFHLHAEAAPELGSGTPGDGCADAIPLTKADSVVRGDTFFAKDDVAGKCSGVGAPDVIYRIELPRRSRVSAHFLSEEGQHVFVLSRSCADRASEVACERMLDQVLAAGTYYLAVDGDSPDAFGQFSFSFGTRDVTAQEAACRAPSLLLDGQTATGTTAGGADKFTTSCGGREDAQSAPDRIYRIALATRAHVRLTLSTPTWDGVLAVRSSCLEAAGATSARQVELACNNDSDDVHHARVDTTLDPGTYYVLVDGHASGNEGPYSLEYRLLR